MRRWYSILLLFVVFLSIAQPPTRSFEKYNSKVSIEPCVDVYVNNEALGCGSMLNKRSKGIITVSKDNINKIYFNITVKSVCGKNEPPVYLRFIKIKQMDLQDLMQYVQDGDEIFIEEYIPAVNKLDLNCSPASFTVHNPS